jgi:hypothetical protein
MEAGAGFEHFLSGGLEMLGIEADEVELGVMRLVHTLYWPAVAELFELDLTAIEPEADLDLSKAPQQ